MIARQSQGALGWRFIIRPNCSASWREVKIFLAIISVACLGVASAFAWVGFWPVLPFAGAEIALLTWALWTTQGRASETEVVDINESEVAIEKGRRRPEQRWNFARAWAQVSLEAPRLRNYPSRLMIGSHGRHISVGGFLAEEERQKLALDLRSVLAGRPPAHTRIDDDLHWSNH